MFKLGLIVSASLVAGQDVASYCTLLLSTCPSVGFSNATCMLAFGNVTVGTAADTNMNTLGCRMAQLTAGNCRYGGVTGGGRCGSVVDSVCNISTTVCGGVTGAAYDTYTDCMSGLSAIQFQWGSLQNGAAGAQNSMECRVYHAIASQTLNDSSHCAHFTASTTGGANTPCSAPITPNATQYCENLQYNCGNGSTSYAQFANKAQCLVVAAGYPTNGSDSATADISLHTLGCREYHAQASQADPGVHCQHAGPTGGGVCGNLRQAWATILAAAPCSDTHVRDFMGTVSTAVLDKLVPPGLAAGQNYSTSFDTAGNTQACRVYHLGVASTSIDHCPHGAVSGGDNCGKYVPNLCAFVQSVCGFGNASYQFNDSATCLTALAGLPAGTTTPWPSTNNTIECRFYHAGVAASYAAGGMKANDASATAMMQAHCSHVLKVSPAGGCVGQSTMTTGTPTPSMKTNAAASISLGVSAIAVAISVYFF